MKFSTTVELLQFWLAKAGVVLGKRSTTSVVDGYVFSVVDGRVQIVCTDRVSFCFVQTQIQVEEEGELFIVPASTLDTILSNSKADHSITLKSLPEDFFEVTCGDYVGEKVSGLHLKDFPDIISVQKDRDILSSGSVESFCNSIQRVQYVMEEGVRAEDYRVLFKDGKCFASTQERLQFVPTDLHKDVSIIVPLNAVKVVKFLELSKASSSELKITESDEHLFFHSGEDVFACQKWKIGNSKKKEKVDEKNQYESMMKGVKDTVSFEIMSAALYSAVVLASVTCESNSTTIYFEFEEDKIFIIGRDKLGNFGYSVLDVDVKASRPEALKTVRAVGWSWVLPAIKATGWKSIKVSFLDQRWLLIEAEESKGMIGQRSAFGVNRIKADKGS